MKYRTFPAATCGPKMASTIPGKACIRYLFDCANIEQNAATINMIVDRPTDSPVVMRQILPTASVLKSTMVKIADILSAHPNPRTSGPSDLQGTQALKSCNRRAITAFQRFTPALYLEDHIGLIPQGKLGRAIGVR